MKDGSGTNLVYRAEYQPFPWSLEQVVLHFDIGDKATRVRARMRVRRNAGVEPANELKLDGQGLELLSVTLDGQVLETSRYSVDDDFLRLSGLPGQFVLETEVLIRPDQNTALEGLYRSGHFLLTQCEAEGFRKITYFPDRPDVMTCFEVTIEADHGRYPVLLSNGNAVASGDSGDGRHWVRWDDPWPKPSYLFALVAGDLACVEDRFTTAEGREVDLKFYVETENADRCGHAVESLINAMRWDEERFGLEYDLDVYHVVATNDFNMGAMENKSLNIFNSKYVLARPDTATDSDYQGIEGVIGHEYFHNWTGNRVTCRDWFQLTLKEGLTVFRDQEFSSDMQSRAVKRIRDVRELRSRQFPEDAGPMSHPIRPDRYQEINNFYTMTVYQKGAEIIRMYHTLLGEEGFQKGMKLYFERHDGAAVTCDDFLAAMADANGADLGAFSRWYGQSGTPVVNATGRYDAAARQFVLMLEQHTPATHGQAEKQALVIPVAMGLLSRKGKPLPLRLRGETEATGTTRLLTLDSTRQEYVFEDIGEAPVPSLFRGFSAPVKFEYPWSVEDLAVLMAHDTDSFVRWEAAQRLGQREILGNVARRAKGEDMKLGPELLEAFRLLLADSASDPALVAEAMILPGEDYLAELMDVIDVDGIHAARQCARRGLAAELEAEFLGRYHALDAGAYRKSASAMAARSLRNVCLSYLLETPGGAELATAQLAASDNMTDSLAALRGLLWTGAAEAEPALADFERKWRDDALVMDKWFVIQSSVPGAGTVARVQELMEHPAFSLANPNKVRSLVGVFAMMNPTAFHAADGSGYRFLAEQVIALNALNPQVAARMAGAFNAWIRYDRQRQALMEKELRRIATIDGLSPDVGEIVSNALQMKDA
jgi:aminopeptidase N